MLIYLRRHRRSTALCGVLLFACLPLCSVGKLVNVTVDDAGEDPRTGRMIEYSGPWWAQPGACPADPCWAQPSTVSLYNGTWHDTSGPNAVAEFLFSGLAVYVICVAVTHPNGVISDTTFLIDGTQSGDYSVNPLIKGPISYSYNVTVFSASLPEGPHNLTIVNHALLELDAIIYTYDDSVSVTPPPSTARPTNSNSSVPTTSNSNAFSTGGIIGVVIAGVVVIVGVGVYFWKRHQRSQEIKPTIQYYGGGQ